MTRGDCDGRVTRLLPPGPPGPGVARGVKGPPAPVLIDEEPIFRPAKRGNFGNRVLEARISI